MMRRVGGDQNNISTSNLGLLCGLKSRVRHVRSLWLVVTQTIFTANTRRHMESSISKALMIRL